MLIFQIILSITSLYILFNLLLLVYYLIKDYFYKVENIKNDNFLPKITILIPAHNEEKVIQNTIESVKQIRYRGSKEIIVIAHNCIDNTFQEAKRTNVMVIDTTIGLTKGSALNQAMRHSTGDIILVIDADTILPADYFEKTIPLMQKFDGLQTEARIYNKQDGFLAYMTDIEFKLYGSTKQYLYSKSNHALLGGNGQFITRKAAYDCELWGDSLADDTELSFRMLKKGYKIGFTNATYIMQEGVNDIKGFVKQRTRWAQGNTLLILDALKLGGLKSINTFFAVNGVLFSPFVKISNIMFIWGILHGIMFNLLDIYFLLFALPYILLLIIGMIKSKINILNVIPYYLYTQMIYLIHFHVIRRIIINDNSWEKTTHSGIIGVK